MEFSINIEKNESRELIDPLTKEGT